MQNLNKMIMPLSPNIEARPAATEGASAVSVRGVSHHYGQRCALNDVSLEIGGGQIYAVLGPNGGGKTTLFRLLSTLIPLQSGAATILQHDLAQQAAAIRHQIGVAFQSPSLDRKLTVAENIRLQGSLYGLSRPETDRRLGELLERFAIADRAHELVERLSGGLRRRVELAKALLHLPPLLLLDEPTTGLDPGSRSDVWQYLSRLRDQQGTTIVFTTHYLGEAETANRLAILSAGKLVAEGSPEALRSSLAGDSLTIETDQPTQLAAAMRERLGLATQQLSGAVRLEVAEGHRLIPQLMEAFSGHIRAIRLGKPTLEDVFIAKTGHRFWDDRSQEVAP